MNDTEQRNLEASYENPEDGGIDPNAPNESLQFILDVTKGYTEKIRTRFLPGLRFSESGLARANSICGWLTGIAQAGNVPMANTLAKEFIGILERLSAYGGKVDFVYPLHNPDNITIQVPSYTVELYDDGCLHSFAVHWYKALVTPELQAQATHIKSFDRWPDTPHGYSFNGGLIYQGPGSGETFTVSLSGRHAWGIHT